MYPPLPRLINKTVGGIVRGDRDNIGTQFSEMMNTQTSLTHAPTRFDDDTGGTANSCKESEANATVMTLEKGKGGDHG